MYFVTVFLNRQWSQQRMCCLTFLWRELTLWVSQPPLGRLWRPLLTLGVSQFQPPLGRHRRTTRSWLHLATLIRCICRRRPTLRTTQTGCPGGSTALHVWCRLGKVAQMKIRKKSGLLPNRGEGGVSEGSKMPNLYFGKVSFIGPRCPWSDLWIRLSLTERRFWNLTDVTLADEDTNSILTDNANRAIQGNVAMHVTLPGGQLWNQCKWCHLVAKIGTNASVAIWWLNL